MKKNVLFVYLLILFIIILSGCGLASGKLERISLKVDKSIPLNESRIINVQYFPSNQKEDINWQSSDESVATIDDGTITANGIGNTTIYATTSSGKTDQIIIEVYKKAESISLNESNIEVYAGETYQLNATILPVDSTYKDVNWKSSDESITTVENGLVTAKKAGESIISATTNENIKTSCNVMVKDKPIEYSGSNDKIISNVNIPVGTYFATLTNRGDRNFIVKLYNGSTDEYGDLLANEIGPYNGSVVVKDGKTDAIENGILEIKSSGKWNIKFEKLSGQIKENEVSGKGDFVTGWFLGDGTRKIATFKNTGEHNFIVKVYDEFGNSDLLVNEIGSYGGQVTFMTETSIKYYYSIISSGNWQIRWE
jgi:hypothetical protein